MESEYVQLRTSDVKKAYESADQSVKNVLAKLMPHVLGRRFSPGALFFRAWDRDPSIKPPKESDLLRPENASRTYVLGHLRNAEYGLINIGTGYQFCATTFCGNEKIGILIPPEVIQLFHVVRELEP